MTNITRLPTDIIDYAMSFVDMNSLGNVSSTCKTINPLSKKLLLDLADKMVSLVYNVYICEKSASDIQLLVIKLRIVLDNLHFFLNYAEKCYDKYELDNGLNMTKSDVIETFMRVTHHHLNGLKTFTQIDDDESLVKSVVFCLYY